MMSVTQFTEEMGERTGEGDPSAPTHRTEEDSAEGYAPPMAFTMGNLSPTCDEEEESEIMGHLDMARRTVERQLTLQLLRDRQYEEEIRIGREEQTRLEEDLFCSQELVSEMTKEAEKNREQLVDSRNHFDILLNMKKEANERRLQEEGQKLMRTTQDL